LRGTGAQQAERTRRYVSSASTVGVQAAERSRLFRGPQESSPARHVRADLFWRSALIAAWRMRSALRDLLRRE